MQLAINDRLRLHHHHRPYGVQSSAVISMISKKPRNSRTRGRGGGDRTSTNSPNSHYTTEHPSSSDPPHSQTP